MTKSSSCLVWYKRKATWPTLSILIKYRNLLWCILSLLQHKIKNYYRLKLLWLRVLKYTFLALFQTTEWIVVCMEIETHTTWKHIALFPVGVTDFRNLLNLFRFLLCFTGECFMSLFVFNFILFSFYYGFNYCYFCDYI